MSRRAVLRGGGVAIGAAALSPFAYAAGDRLKIATLAEIQPLQALAFSYPRDDSAYLIDLGRPVGDGIGAGQSIVAFSNLCQHMGCPVEFEADKPQFFCGCHASIYDPLEGGIAVAGPAPRGLPRIALEIDGEAVFAVGVAEGLVYGRACNG
jgi:arsenite oxidase small subunit